MDAIREYRPHLFEGFFYSCNADAFVIASDIQSGILKSAKSEWLKAIDELIEDLEAITATHVRKYKYLADTGISLRELLDDIENYDNLSATDQPD